MKYTMRDIGDFVVIELQGKIDIGSGDIELRKCLADTAARGAERIILDMARVSYMDSSGIGDLVRAYLALRKQGVWLCLARLNRKVYNLMTLTQLVTVFPIYDSVEDAMMTYRQAA